MHVQHFDIQNGPVLMTTPVHGDTRGCFHESYHAGEVKQALGYDPGFVQDNVSRSITASTLRGLHLQMEPHAQGKLIQCLQGKIWDVAVDARPDSETFGQTVGVSLAQDSGQMFWVPPGFLHGFVTRTDNVLVTYKVTSHYSPGHDVTVAWDDPDLAIDWRLPSAPKLSNKDANGLSFSDLTKRLQALT